MPRHVRPGIAEMLDEALDLPPAAIMQHIAQLAAAAGALRRLVRREIAEPFDQIGRFARGGRIGNVHVSLQVGFRVWLV